QDHRPRASDARPATETQSRVSVQPVCWVSSLVSSKQDKASLFGGSGVKVSDALKPVPSVPEILLGQRESVTLGINGKITPPKVSLGDGGQGCRDVTNLLWRLEADDVIWFGVEQLTGENRVS